MKKLQAEPARTRSRMAAILHHEATGGILVMMAAALALLVDNSPLAKAYEALLATPVSLRFGALRLDKDFIHVVNDGLMAVFFLLVGLEIKREFLDGELSSRDRAVLPIVAAFGGMVVPSLIYAGLNWGNAAALPGWAIPAATDIAFAVAVLTLVGPRVPLALKVFLLALAIIDDLGAIIIIALFYTADLSVLALGLAALGVAALAALNRGGVTRTAPYMLIGVFIWICVLKSGVHATLAGVVVALAVPMQTGKSAASSTAQQLETTLHPWVTYLIVPLFAFANAGVSLAGLSPSALVQPIPLGIALGLLIGKPIGIVGAAWLAVKAGLGKLPDGATWMQMVGVGLVAGIGFTMSLFIGTLAFPDPSFALPIRLGVLTGSIVAASLGYVVLRRSTRA